MFLLELTLHIIVGFPTSDPLSSPKAPVVRVSQNHLYKHVVMGGEVESGDVEAEEWEHPSGKIRNRNNQQLCRELKQHVRIGFSDSLDYNKYI